MPGARPWFMDSGPANAADKSIQLMKSTPKNARVANLLFEGSGSYSTNNATAWTNPTLGDIQSLLDIFISSAKLVCGGKTLWTLAGSELFTLSIAKARNMPTFIGIDANGLQTGQILDNAGTAVVELAAIPFYFNNPTHAYPSLLAPGVAQLYLAELTWTRGDSTAGFVTNSGGRVITTYSNVRLHATLQFELGYFVCPMAFIDKINLSNANTPISGGYIPYVVSKKPGNTSATGEIKTYATPYGEEIHGQLPTELAVAFGENGKCIYDKPEVFLTPYKYPPQGANIEESLPSENGENMEITTVAAAENILVERYQKTDDFLGPVVSALGSIADKGEWTVAGLPGSLGSKIPNAYLAYMPKRLVT